MKTLEDAYQAMETLKEFCRDTQKMQCRSCGLFHLCQPYLREVIGEWDAFRGTTDWRNDE